MPHVVRRDFAPIILRTVIGTPTTEEMADQLVRNEQELERDHAGGLRTVSIVDITLAGRLNASQRKLQAEWIQRHARLLAVVSVGTAFVTPNSVTAGILTAMFWLQRPPDPYLVVPDKNAALDWAIEQLRKAKIPLPAKLDDLRGWARERTSIDARPR